MKESLGTSTEVLARFTRALSNNLKDGKTAGLQYVWLRSRPASGRQRIEVRIPLRNLARELEEQLPRAAIYRDLPRGRKKPEWKREFARSLEAAGRDLSGVTKSQIMQAIRGYRAGRKGLPEIAFGTSRKSV